MWPPLTGGASKGNATHSLPITQPHSDSASASGPGRRAYASELFSEFRMVAKREVSRLATRNHSKCISLASALRRALDTVIVIHMRSGRRSNSQFKRH